MMEQTQMCKAEDHIMLITRLNDVIITDRATGFSHILDPTLIGSFNIITKWEESITTKYNILILFNPGFLFFWCQYLRSYLESIHPDFFTHNIIMIF